MIEFMEYQEARPHLEQNLGEYCSYCEMKVTNALAVEHVFPKSKHECFERVWCNFLLSCTYCNGNKQAKDPDPSELLWPDRDDTFRAFRYLEECAIEVNPEVAPEVRARAYATMCLVALQQFPGGEEEPSPRDKRWTARREAWRKAARAKQNLDKTTTEPMREQIIDTATSVGFFSVWMTVFSGDSEMRKRLISAFSGTQTEYFSELLGHENFAESSSLP